MELEDLKDHTEPLAVEYLGQTLNLNYFSERVTPDYINELQAYAKRGERGDADFIADIIDSWDMTLKGETIPPTGEHVGKLSYGLQVAIAQAVMNDVANPTKARSQTSRVISRRKAKSDV